MKAYTYRNVKTREVLFDIIMRDDAKLTDVDILFEKETGIDPFKVMWVAVTTIKL